MANSCTRCTGAVRPALAINVPAGERGRNIAAHTPPAPDNIQSPHPSMSKQSMVSQNGSAHHSYKYIATPLFYRSVTFRLDERFADAVISFRLPPSLAANKPLPPPASTERSNAPCCNPLHPRCFPYGFHRIRRQERCRRLRLPDGRQPIRRNRQLCLQPEQEDLLELRRAAAS